LQNCEAGEAQIVSFFLILTIRVFARLGICHPMPVASTRQPIVDWLVTCDFITEKLHQWPSHKNMKLEKHRLSIFLASQWGFCATRNWHQEITLPAVGLHGWSRILLPCPSSFCSPFSRFLRMQHRTSDWTPSAPSPSLGFQLMVRQSEGSDLLRAKPWIDMLNRG
jgi:hypothetical protein